MIAPDHLFPKLTPVPESKNLWCRLFGCHAEFVKKKGRTVYFRCRRCLLETCLTHLFDFRIEMPLKKP